MFEGMSDDEEEFQSVGLFPASDLIEKVIVSIRCTYRLNYLNVCK